MVINDNLFEYNYIESKFSAYSLECATSVLEQWFVFYHALSFIAMMFQKKITPVAESNIYFLKNRKYMTDLHIGQPQNSMSGLS